MVARLGNVLYWAFGGLGILLWIASIVIQLTAPTKPPFPYLAYIFTHPYSEHAVPATVLAIVGVLSILLGLAFRYILAGPSAAESSRASRPRY